MGENQGFNCELCQKTFTRRYNLTLHLKSHDLENIEVCDICSVTFKSKKLLLVHRSNEHKYTEEDRTCRCCGKTFDRFDSMKRHMKRVHKVLNIVSVDKSKPISKKFYCELCRRNKDKCPGDLRGFNSEDQLEAHRNAFHKCEICLKLY